jgi:uncharacterized protein (DUF2147 family)
MFNKLLVISFIFVIISSGCDDDTTQPVCGDRVINVEFGEQCDGTSIPDTATINSICGENVAMNSCSNNCTIICELCGNGVIDATGNEQCDGSNLGTASCENEGFYPGTGGLSCNSDCTFNYDDCGGICGDSIIQTGAGEDCDQNSLGVLNCIDFTNPLNYHGGTLSCATDCKYNTDLCEYCGDGTINGTEQCDGTEPFTCDELNSFGGTTTCSDTCTIPPADCKNIIQWGTEQDEHAHVVVLDSNRNIYITGYTEGSLDGTNAGGLDIFLTKFTHEGTLLWNRQWGTPGDDEAYSMVIDSSNNIYITGYTMGSLDGANAGARDIFLTKFTSDGTHLWNKQWGTLQSEWGMSITIDSTDNLYMTGPVNFGNMYLRKYTTDGTLIWDKEWGSLDSDSPYKVVIDSSSNLYISGFTSGSLDGPNAGAYDLFLTKFSYEGTHLWNRQWGTDDYEECSDLKIDSNGNIYITGYTDGSFDGTNAGYADICLTKFSSDGTHLWNKQWGTSEDDYAGSLVIDSSNNIYITGYTEGSIDGTNAGFNDIVLTKFSSDGTLLWNKQWGTSENERTFSITIDTTNNLYIAGFTWGSFDGTNQGFFDLFLLRTDTNP